MKELTEKHKKITLKMGKRYSICGCGQSLILPFCDGAHKEINKTTGSNYKSIKLIPNSDSEIFIYCSNWKG